MPRFVIPGEVLSTEEEFMPSRGTFVENGNIVSASAGGEETTDGRVSVKGSRNVGSFSRGMAVLGLVTDDLRSVVFIRLNELAVNGTTYVALKDAKLVPPRPDMHRGPKGEKPEPTKAVGVGDIVTGLIIAEDKDVYTLSINMPQFGVVHSMCEECGGPLDYDPEKKTLSCRPCEREQRRKLSTAYGDMDAINDLLKKYVR